LRINDPRCRKSLSNDLAILPFLNRHLVVFDSFAIDTGELQIPLNRGEVTFNDDFGCLVLVNFLDVANKLLFSYSVGCLANGW